ncbi:unnamed protein product [Lupinus luteus]|uniref:Uncharacterized protein n=1 Tax=Lupinus luteus TaxID=3873 RepID=A0AAV1WVN7_LUPLU
MDVFIPEDYVIKRRVEKMAAATSMGKGSKSLSYWNTNRTKTSAIKASSSTKGFVENFEDDKSEQLVISEEDIRKKTSETTSL